MSFLIVYFKYYIIHMHMYMYTHIIEAHTYTFEFRGSDLYKV